MKLEYLRKQLEIVTGTLIKEVFFDQSSIVNTESKKEYPYIFWDLNSYRSTMNWSSTTQQRESVTMKAYCVGYLDKQAYPVTSSDLLEKKYDELREAFRTYLTILNTNAYIQVTNLDSMTNELFPWGFSVDSEVGVSFDVKFDLFCNASV